MFTKSKISQSMIDAVNKVLEHNQPEPEPIPKTPAEGGRVPWVPNTTTLTESSEKVTTPTGMKVYGSSYGNSAKARKDQTKSAVDTLKGPKDKEMKEELKGDQDKIDANHNGKIDGQDFDILRKKKKVKEDMHFANKLLETVRKSDVPAYLRKAKGDTPLTVADVKGPKKDSISAPENLAKNRNEWKEDTDYSEEQLDEMLNEVLGKDATAGDWIHDFVHSDNPKFAGKSKAERKKMALGAYYGKQNEATNYEPSDAAVTTDTLAGRMAGGKMNSFKSYKLRVKPLDKEGEPKPGDDTPKTIQPQDTPARRSHEVKEATIAGTPGWKKIPKEVKDKSGAVHTPMSRARDLARSAFKKIKNETMMGKAGTTSESKKKC
jgi:hypothetical protein